MKVLGMMIVMMMNVSVMAASINSFTVNGTKAEKATVYLVAGKQFITGGFVVSKVFKKIGTFNADGSGISIPETEYKKDGFRGPSHVLVVSHDQAHLSLNKYSVDANSQFGEPEYMSIADRIQPDGSNTDYSQRKAIQFRRVDKSGRFDF
ncbi:hypothetical protein A9Q84_19915 [Halobacteriovorax marinus]|uniref:Uncharacterized protein n=1 Tax=Halobacteriovorax marinus TaxID=97084 RepID=A0A1Y5F2R4_9BACT|nr:hypothetical protein A9Q84_19915 [Halobacteriovorax marinus]